MTRDARFTQTHDSLMMLLSVRAETLHVQTHINVITHDIIMEIASFPFVLFHINCLWRTNLYLISQCRFILIQMRPIETTLQQWSNNPNFCYILEVNTFFTSFKYRPLNRIVHSFYDKNMCNICILDYLWSHDIVITFALSQPFDIMQVENNILPSTFYQSW